jgi:DNA-binding beta-propeller fold protein YncE
LSLRRTRVSAGIFVGVLLAVSLLSLVSPDQARAEGVVSTINVSARPYSVDVDQRTDMVYVANNLIHGGISIVSGSSDQMVDNVATGFLPISVSVNPNTNMVYVANYGRSNVAVVNGSTDRLVADVLNILYPGALVVNPDTDRVYVGGATDSNVTVIDGGTDAVIGVIKEDCGPVIQFAVDPVTDTIYATTSFTYFGDSPPGCVLVINGQTDEVAGEIFLGRAAIPAAIAVDTRTDMVYVGDSLKPLLYMINGSTNALVGNLTIADTNIAGIAINPATGMLFASHSYSHTVSVVDLVNGTILTSIPVQGRDVGVALDVATGKVYVVDFTDGLLYVISAAGSAETNLCSPHTHPQVLGPLVCLVHYRR